MCGIAGIVQKGAPNRDKEVRAMIARLAHRGPDGVGFYASGGCTLGHARLSIIDLVTGTQPMTDGRTAVTFNGEIFGYQDIRKRLSSYSFKTGSDTETILALYATHGEDIPKHLPGQFAFALWDEGKKKLVCARDRFGEKPFYYAIGRGGEFLFASEIKALLASGLIDPVLDRDSLAHYLKHLYVHPTKTMYKNIHVLPPAHVLIWEDRNVSIARYWNLPPTGASISFTDAAEKLSVLLDRSVQEQLVADVPVGAFLSGGLDSSTIVALASRHTNRLKTFSFRFDAERDETPFAREVAQRYGTDHTELAPEHHDLGELLRTMQDVYDEPFADSSNIPTYLLSEAAHAHVKVALTGDGGDELFGGYAHWYRPLLAMHGRSARPPLLAVARLYLKARIDAARRTEYLGARFKQKFSSLLHAHENQDAAFDDRALASLANIPLPAAPQENSGQTIDDVMREDLQNYMPGDILVKIDRASMAHGLELRAPFLGKEFAEFAVSLPWQLKISGDGEKRVFREAFGELWTEKVRTRAKQGFGAPVGRWLAEPSVARMKEILNDPRARIFSLLSFKNTRPYIPANDQRAWSLLVLALWAESHGFTLD